MALHKENTMTIAIAVIFASVYVASLLKVAAVLLILVALDGRL
jgi:hypothetical protein